MSADQSLIEDILAIWFGRPADADWGQPRDCWFFPTAEFDRLLAERFSDATGQAARGDLDHLAADAQGTLALLVLLDQLPRNLYRDDPKAFASDAKALALATDAIGAGTDRLVEPIQRWFFYLPFEHSENIGDQDRSVALFASLGPDHQQGLDYAERHRAIIRRFGRFPHRNRILGRAGTPQETAFLETSELGF